MRTKSIGLILFVAFCNLTNHVFAEDEPDIDDVGGAELDEPEPEIPLNEDDEAEPILDPEEEDEEEEEPEPEQEEEPEVEEFVPEVKLVERNVPTQVGECEIIEQSPLADDANFFNFHQHDERLDPNELLKVAYQIISTIKAELVKKLVLDYNPQLHRDVGPYSMTAHVTTFKDGKSHEHCYEIWIRILDTDECTHEEHAEYRHQCDESTTCVNTEGSYYCACNDGEFAVPGSGAGACKDESTSEQCCGDNKDCRADFKCHSNKCAFNDCHEDATCIPGSDANSFSCACNDGFRDVGKVPGYECTPVDHCTNNKCAANCECESVINATVDGYYCHPKEGEIAYYPRAEEWEVLPEEDSNRLDGAHLCLNVATPPVLVMEGPDPMILEQGSPYVELGVTIVDEDTGDLKRRFTADYNDAPDLMHPSGFVKRCGQSVVSYSIDTPWISSRPTLSTSREVEVVDVDECLYTGEDEEFKHNCVGFATCNNQICSEDAPGFTCVCLDDGYEVDGNQGCEDKRPPVLECHSDDPNCGFKHLWVMKGAGMVLDESGTPVVLSVDDSDDPTWLEQSIAQITRPHLQAYDLIPVIGGGEDEALDLTSEIKKGVLTSYESNMFIQPYSVFDENGNEANFNVQFTVTTLTTEMIAHLLPQLNSGVPPSSNDDDDADGESTSQTQNTADVATVEVPLCDGSEPQAKATFWDYFWFLFFVYCTYLALVALVRVATVLQCLVLPSSMSHQRDRFFKGMDSLLYLQSFGNISPGERDEIIQQKWKDLSSFNR
jgi:hypothetical protein